MTEPIVRATEADDVTAVQRVARAAWLAAYDDLIDPDQVDETVDSWYDPDRLVADDVCDPERPFFVAERTGAGEEEAEASDVVGFGEAATGDEPGVWHLYRIYVHPDAWGEGVGTALLERVEAAVHERGGDELRVSVHAGNEVGVDFYEARGFERVATVPDEEFGGDRHEYVEPL